MAKNFFSFIGMLALWQLPVFAQPARTPVTDSLMAALPVTAKAGQLFLLPAAGPWPEEKTERLIDDVKKFRPGGLVFSGTTIFEMQRIVRAAQQASAVPLLIVADENELLESLDSVRHFPRHLLLASIPDDSLVHQVYRLAAFYLKQAGAHITTGMYFDAMPGPGDSTHSLHQVGSDPARMEAAAARWIGPLRAGRMSAMARFASARDTLQVDTAGNIAPFPFHKPDYRFLAWPEMQLARSNDFQYRVREEAFVVPAWKSNRFTRTVRQKINFSGLLAAECFERGDALQALRAGNDLVIEALTSARPIHEIVRASRRNKTFGQQLDRSVRSMLNLKERLGLFLRDTSAAPGDAGLGQTPASRVLLQTAFRQSVTVVKNEDLLPFRNLDFLNLWYAEVGAPPQPGFEARIQSYANVQTLRLRTPADTALLSRLPPGATVIAGVFDGGPLAEAVNRWLRRSAFQNRTVVCHFAELSGLNEWLPFAALLAGYTPVTEMQQAVAQNLFGVQPGSGRLPTGTAETASVQALHRFSFDEPEAAGLCSETLKKIDGIVHEAIALGATPGAQVVVARHGRVVYQKNFGALDYATAQPVTDSTLYDLASVTKVAATLQAISFLYDRNLIDVSKKVSFYLPELKGTNKENMTLRDILTHQAGLWPFLPFWASTLKDSLWLPGYYARTPSPEYPWPVAENLYARQSIKDSLWHWVVKSRVREKSARTPYDYRYSDMGFYLLHRLAEKLLQQPMEDFLTQNLYEPLGAGTLGYLPRQRFGKHRIAPTEHDKLFRKSLLTGYVHDQGAALHGGVAGHAGLFGTALDLAKLGQFWLNRGLYGDTYLYSAKTLDHFTARQFASSRRGLGWDKPLLSDWTSPTSRFASSATFGHTGFTGTCIWVDPHFDLVYVFLSNRVHPDMNNNKLISLNIRPRVQDVIYQAIFNFSLYHAPSETKAGLTGLHQKQF
jgi:CubicO group peptidase (beta-lactamase class C family)/beta-glucosidase-like glycosyl hydrolase